MLQDIDEKLSMLVDNELGVDEALKLLDLIESDEQLQRKWERLNSAKEAIHTGKFTLGEQDFVSRVSVALEAEPVIFAPKNKSSRKRASISTDKGWRTGLAVAASAALIAIFADFNGNGLNNSTSNMPSDSLAQSVAPSKGPIEQVSLAMPLSVQSGSQSAMNDSDNIQFSDYQAMHNESAYSVGAQGILPYARFANYQVDQ